MAPTDPSWADQEKWAWSMISNGKSADFTKSEEIDDFGFKPNPEINEDRVLSSKFLQSILLDEEYYQSIRRNLEIIGATFYDEVNLESQTIQFPISLTKCQFQNAINLNYLRSEWTVDFANSKFLKVLSLNSVDINGNLILRGASIFELDLRHANIRGQISLVESQIEDKLKMNSLIVSRGLLMNSLKASNYVDMVYASVGETLNMDGCTFNEKLNLNNLTVGKSLSMCNCTCVKAIELKSARIKESIYLNNSNFENVAANDLKVDGNITMKNSLFQKVKFITAKIGGQIRMEGSTFNKILDMNSMSVGGHILMCNVVAHEHIDLGSTSIGGGLDLSAGSFRTFDLSGTLIQKIRLGIEASNASKWSENSVMNLRNAKIESIVDTKEGWPEHLILEGFIYKNLGGYGSDQNLTFIGRSTKWLKNWLEKQSNFSPQPYSLLGKVLNDAGYKTKSRSVLFFGKKREMKEAKWFRKIGLFMSMITVGFGYYNAIALIWVALLSFIGSFVIQGADVSTLNDLLINNTIDKLFFSLDLLLPIIKLQGSHYEVPLVGGIKYYFFFQQIMGYILASFLVAGLSGITKK